MRFVALVALAALVVGSAARAAEKPEDRAKSAAEAFLKAVKAKDVPAAVKASDVPFLLPDIKAKEPKHIRVEKADDLAAALKPLIEGVGGPDAVGEVQSLATLKKQIGDGPESKLAVVKEIFEVGGADGFLVSLVDAKEQRAGTLLVRVKGESAKVVGIVATAGAAKKE